MDAYIQQRNVLGYNGDNRGPSANCSQCSYRVEVLIDFTKKTVDIKAGDSHIGGIDVGKGSTGGSSWSFNGNTATVHVNGNVAGPLGLFGSALGKTVQADLTISLAKNGTITGQVSHTQFPSFEAYAYSNGHATTLFTYTEQPRNWFGPLFLGSCD